MPTIADWLMVGITFIYVIATIIICVANLNSAKATRDQLSEMRHEHDENIRMSIMPYFEVNCNNFNPKIHKDSDIIWSFTNFHGYMKEGYKTGLSSLTLKNIGVNLAILICVKLEYGEIKNEIKSSDIVNLAIRPGEEHYIKIMNIVPLSELDDSNYIGDIIRTNKPRNAKIILEFNDILNNHYLQIAHICFALSDLEKDALPFISKDAKVDIDHLRRKCGIYIRNCFTEPPVFVKKV